MLLAGCVISQTQALDVIQHLHADHSIDLHLLPLANALSWSLPSSPPPIPGLLPSWKVAQPIVTPSPSARLRAPLPSDRDDPTLAIPDTITWQTWIDPPDDHLPTKSSATVGHDMQLDEPAQIHTRWKTVHGTILNGDAVQGIRPRCKGDTGLIQGPSIGFEAWHKNYVENIKDQKTSVPGPATKRARRK